ncbi:MAG TPA: IclR family transcriptional regulator C-terminal domain-containing protein [Dongiaceae bacterium]|nr:IclR family transcriptional regulator C-terminal domain-containing protein [Dongiaceae bacterium]
MKKDRAPEQMGGFAKGLSVIEAFGQGGDRLTIAEAAKRTGLDRATARRCLLTLVDGGYAFYDGKFFALTPRVLRLGYAYIATTPLPRQLQPFLEQLSEATQESSSAAILDGAEIVYIARSSLRRVMSIGLSVGSRLPAYCSSMGRVLLAALPEDEMLETLRRGERIARTPKTLTSIKALAAEIGRVRMQGYAVIDEELELGLRSIAVPILDSAGGTVAALNTGLQAARATPERMVKEFLPKLLDVQRTLARLLL